MKGKKHIVSLIAALVVTCNIFPTTSLYGATTTKKTTYNNVIRYTLSSSQTVTASQTMSLVLYPGQSSYSNIVTFNFNKLPSNAIVKDVKVAATAYKHSGLGAILAERLRVTDPVGDTQEVAWGRGNITDISTFVAKKAAGTWSVSYYGVNLASASSGTQFIGAVEYKPVTMTITYILE